MYACTYMFFFNTRFTSAGSVLKFWKEGIVQKNSTNVKPRNVLLATSMFRPLIIVASCVPKLQRLLQTNWFFFYFETDQESGEHAVNFAVAQYADGREKVFKGYDSCNEFCTWLFPPAHRGFTAIAHNLKGWL